MDEVEAMLEALGRNVRGQCEQRGMTMDELAQATERPVALIEGIERADQGASMIDLVRIAWALDVPPADLLKVL
jgi:transcriptional regulator with XRE-family HTH domain